MRVLERSPRLSPRVDDGLCVAEVGTLGVLFEPVTEPAITRLVCSSLSMPQVASCSGEKMRISWIPRRWLA